MEPTLVVNAVTDQAFWRLPPGLPSRLAAALPPPWRLQVVSDGAALPAAVRGAAALLGWPVPAGLARRAPDLARACFLTAGVPAGWEALGDRIAVTTARGATAASVAQHALFLILAGLRGAPPAWAGAGAAEVGAPWHPDGWEVARAAERLTVTLLGRGEVGGRLLALLAPLVGALRAVGRTEPGAASLLAASDVVVLALPDTPQARARFTAEAFFAHLKPDVLLVNVARGALLCEPPLLAFLAAHPRARYLADVAHPEPYPADGPLWACPQVTLTPHLGGRREDTWARLEALALAWVRGLPGARW